MSSAKKMRADQYDVAIRQDQR